jgi:hypothetical protein
MIQAGNEPAQSNGSHRCPHRRRMFAGVKEKLSQNRGAMQRGCNRSEYLLQHCHDKPKSKDTNDESIA